MINTAVSLSATINRARYQGVARLAFIALLAVLLNACATDGVSIPNSRQKPTGAAESANRILACKSGDQQISSQAQCLLDDAACYQIADGGWCTGPRGNVCPTGSQTLPAGTACPSGARCFRFSESLECFIQ